MGIFDSRSMEVYDPHADTWKTLGGTHYPRKWYNCAMHDGELYIIGGKVDSEIVSSVRIYNLQRHTIRSISSMNTKLRYVGAVGLNSFVYVCGGSNANHKSNVVESYCPATDEWKIMSPMHVSREDLAVVACQGYVYALGGCDEVSALDSVERYNPRIDQWMLLASTMNQKRFSFGAAVLGDKIYVCGGSSSKLLVSLKTMEVYDPKTNRWEYRPSMNTPRWGMLLISSMGKLWAIGGWDKSLPLSTIEVYPKFNVWTFAPSYCKIKGSVTGLLLAI
ncbi:kelch-like protein 18 [Nasonia vitripennis]|uniref:Uncharacterized protein n=1 Tax=Nasonia vitripennis TaxID=7425 RepID=A0A7M7Q1D9_NASVI|nr:kelch-like protein 18 [Nasonia vitripennis]